MNINFNNIQSLISKLNNDKLLQLSNIQWIEPIGIAILKLYKVANPEVKIELTGKDGAINYCKTILEGTSSNPKSYIPFVQFTNETDSIAKQVTQKIINNVNKLPPKDQEDLSKYLNYLISEMMDNVVSHSRSPHGGFVTAQYYPGKNKVQVVIIDNGIGLKQALSKKYTIQNEKEAILKAMEEGVTGSNEFDIYKNIPKHAGRGLFFLSKIIQETKGNLLIVSNNTIFRLNEDSMQELKTNFSGTIICFEIEEENINFTLHELMRMIMYVEDEEDIF